MFKMNKLQLRYIWHNSFVFKTVTKIIFWWSTDRLIEGSKTPNGFLLLLLLCLISLQTERLWIFHCWSHKKSKDAILDIFNDPKKISDSLIQKKTP